MRSRVQDAEIYLGNRYGGEEQEGRAGELNSGFLAGASQATLPCVETELVLEGGFEVVDIGEVFD